MSYRDRAIEAYQRGECSYEGMYDHIREQDADKADFDRKRDREERVVAVREDGSYRTEPDEEPPDWRERWKGLR